MAIHLLAIASNYTGESYALPDCELDAAAILAAFQPYCETAKGLIGPRATREGITKAVRTLIGSLNSGDLGILYFSGHGTYETVKGKRVEAIVCHGGSLIYDFEKRQEFNKRRAGSLIAAASDSCFSGGMLRAKWLPGKKRAVDISKLYPHKIDLPTKSPTKPNAEFSASDVKEVSYSTGHGGAWTLAFLKSLAASKFNTTLPALHKRIRKLLPSDEWPQSPQLSIDASLAKRTLKSFAGKA